MLGQRRRRWARIKSELVQCLVFIENYRLRHINPICIGVLIIQNTDGSIYDRLLSDVEYKNKYFVN